MPKYVICPVCGGEGYYTPYQGAGKNRCAACYGTGKLMTKEYIESWKRAPTPDKGDE